MPMTAGRRFPSESVSSKFHKSQSFHAAVADVQPGDPMSTMVEDFLRKVLLEKKEYNREWTDYDIRIIYEYFLITAKPNSNLDLLLARDTGTAPGDGDDITLDLKGVQTVMRQLRIGEDDASKQLLLHRHMHGLSMQQAQSGASSKHPASVRIDFRTLVQVIYALMAGDEPIETKLAADAWFPFDPDHRNKNLWDLLMVILLLYTTFAVPYVIAFADASDPTKMTPFDIWELGLDGLFMTDILANFCTAFYHQGEYVTDLKRISYNYATTWFPLDFAGSFPFDKVVAAIVLAQGADSTELSFMKAFRIVRMLKLIRAVRLMDKLNQLEQKEGFVVFKKMLRIFKSIFLMLFVSHLLGCFFTMLIDPGSTVNWLEAYDPELVNSPAWERYTVSLYWAIITISTMGYGDVLPVNTNERIFSIGVALIGAVVFSYSMGNITSLISQTAGADVKFDEKLRFVEEWLDFRKMSQPVKRRVKSFLHQGWRRAGVLFDEKANMRELPRETRIEIRRQIFTVRQEMLLSEAPGLDPANANIFSSTFPEEIMGDLLSRMVSIHVDKNEFVYKFGDYGDEAFLVDKGEVEIVSYGHDKTVEDVAGDDQGSRTSTTKEPSRVSYDSRTPLQSSVDPKASVILCKGQTFGVMALFPDICQFRAESVRVKSETAELLCLSRKDLEEVAVEYPEAAYKFREFAELSNIQMKQKMLHLELTKARSSRSLIGHGVPGELDLQISKMRTELKINMLNKVRSKLGPQDRKSVMENCQFYTRLTGKTANKAPRCLRSSTALVGSGPLNLGRIHTMEVGDEGDVTEDGWQQVTSWISSQGELMYFSYTEEGLTAESASSFGFLRKRLSRFYVSETPDMSGYYTADLSVFSSPTSKQPHEMKLKALDANDYVLLQDYLNQNDGISDVDSAEKAKSAFGKLKLKSHAMMAFSSPSGNNLLDALKKHTNSTNSMDVNLAIGLVDAPVSSSGEALVPAEESEPSSTGDEVSGQPHNEHKQNGQPALLSPQLFRGMPPEKFLGHVAEPEGAPSEPTLSLTSPPPASIQGAGSTEGASEGGGNSSQTKDIKRLSDRIYGVERKILVVLDKLDALLYKEVNGNPV